MTIRDKATGRELDDVRDLVARDAGSEWLAIMFGNLLKMLCDNGTISEQDAIELTRSGHLAEVVPR